MGGTAGQRAWVRCLYSLYLVVMTLIETPLGCCSESFSMLYRGKV